MVGRTSILVGCLYSQVRLDHRPRIESGKKAWEGISTTPQRRETRAWKGRQCCKLRRTRPARVRWWERLQQSPWQAAHSTWQLTKDGKISCRSHQGSLFCWIGPAWRTIEG